MRHVLVVIATAVAVAEFAAIASATPDTGPVYRLGLGANAGSLGQTAPQRAAKAAVAARRDVAVPARARARLEPPAAQMQRKLFALPGMQARPDWPGSRQAVSEPTDAARAAAATAAADESAWTAIAAMLAASGLALAGVSIVFNRRRGPERPPVAG